MNRAVALAVISVWALTFAAGMEASEPAVRSEVERMIWDREAAYLDNVAAGNLAEVQKSWHDEFVGWPSHSPDPVDRERGRRSLEELLSGTEITGARIQPRAMRIVGEIAIVHYVAEFEQRGADGKTTPSSMRITHTWLRTPDGWKIIGGMSARR